MKTLHFIATGDKYNSYDVYFMNKKIDSCDINSKQKVTQAHIVIASVIYTLKSRFKNRDNHLFDITFDDTKALYPRTEYATSNLLDMAACVPSNILKVYNIEPQ